MYNKATIILLRLVALYFILGLIPMIGQVCSLSVTQPLYAVSVFIQVAFAIGIWFFAPSFSKQIIDETPDSETGSQNSDDICYAILMAEGCLIMSGAFQYSQFWFDRAIKGAWPFSSYDFWASIAHLSFGLLLFMKPKAIWKSILKLRNA